MNAMTGVAVLGCTGSIGESTLDVLRRHPAKYRAAALLAHRNVELLVRQAQEFRPDVVAIADGSLEEELRTRLRRAGLAPHVLAGPDAATAVAVLHEARIVVAAIVGAAGLPSTLAAAGAPKPGDGPRRFVDTW